MISEPLTVPGDGLVSVAYAALIERGALHRDPAQLEAAGLLDDIARALEKNPRNVGFLARLFDAPAKVTGAYLHGDVGRGKTMLMDLFYSSVAEPRKRRVHFHQFMDEIHVGIAQFRKKAKARGDDSDPIAAVVKPIIKTSRLLCLDEFHVHDITNAMLLQRLFEQLFANGVVLVATSNVAPDGLYKDGLNRHLFLPFIELLKANTTVAALPAARDYRREKFVGQKVYAIGEGDAARARMDKLWTRVTGGVEARPTSVESLGRQIHVPLAAMGAARFDFADLCEKPLGVRDYVRLAHAFDTILIDDVPQFSRVRTDAAKRFILLIDNLYDRGVKLGASFAVPIEALGQDDKTRFEFARTASRLMEMSSDEYLAQALRDTGPPEA
ncbi:cell division protein ZapE [Devosia rhodophyticola]|uniref:Cell division protein ZapE n=1 Tax=Devosia rhodophyticola TaxID=3026423 RepID=A0ABY7YU32_9HYPH|nr:cell division protein ZapE [Devosia rhodophyticola]WDR04464.1 cell division protein ZapE [Devosia rhodophyticola]